MSASLNNNEEKMIDDLALKLKWESKPKKSKGYIVKDSEPVHYLDTNIDYPCSLDVDPQIKNLYHGIQSGDWSLNEVDNVISEMIRNQPA